MLDAAISAAFQAVTEVRKQSNYLGRTEYETRLFGRSNAPFDRAGDVVQLRPRVFNVGLCFA